VKISDILAEKSVRQAGKQRAAQMMVRKPVPASAPQATAAPATAPQATAPTATGGTVQQTATGTVHKASPNNPNQPTVATAQPATPAAPAATPTSTGGTVQQTATGTVHTSNPNNPNQKFAEPPTSSNGKRRWLPRAAVKVRRGYRTAKDTPAGAAAGAAIGGAASGIAAGLAQAAQGAGDPMGLGGYQDYTKNANQ
jgi:hypothetical protein